MNRDELADLRELLDTSSPIVVAEMVGGPDRTLLFGQSSDGQHWHVYLKEDAIHLHRYRDVPGGIFSTLHMAEPEWNGFDLIPDRRLHPAASDVHFAKLLRRKEIYLPWAEFDDEQYEAASAVAYFGRTGC